MDEAKLQEIDERRARVLRDGTAAGALRMAADDVPTLVAEVRRLTAALEDAKDQCEAAESVADYRLGTMRLALRRSDAEEVEDVDFLDVLRAEHAAALDAARREGAEGMRAAAARCCSPDDDHFDGFHAPDVWEQIEREIRALPLDAPGGGS